MQIRRISTAAGAAVAVGLVAVVFAQNTERTDKVVLEAVKKATEINFETLENAGPEKAAAEARKVSDKVFDLIKELETNHAKSPLLTDARRQALKATVLLARFVKDDAELKRTGDLAAALLAAAAKGSDDAALSDLAVNQMQFLKVVRGIKSLDDFKVAWAKEEAEFTKRAESFFASYPKYREGADFYAELMDMYNAVGAEKLRGLVLGHISKNFADHPLAKVAARDAKVGAEFVFKFTPVGSAKETSIADLRGKVVVIDFWATWCGPCVREMPSMKKLYAEYKEKGVEFIGVSLDDNVAPLNDFVKKNAVGWPQVQGAAAEKLSTDWGVQGIPTLFIVDKKGNLRSMTARGRLEKLIPELLAEK